MQIKHILLIWILICITAIASMESDMWEKIKSGSTIGWAVWYTGQDVNDLTSYDKFKSVAKIHATSNKPNGDLRHDDEIWVVVNRDVNGVNFNSIEQFTPLDWGDDPNYCWFVDGGLAGSSAAVAAVPEIPEVPPAATRPEAYVASNDREVVWFDPNYDALSYDTVGANHNLSSCVGVDSEGNVVAGTLSNTTDYKIVCWDTDLNKTYGFYEPDAGWSVGQAVFSVKFSPDDAYLYAMAGGTLYKFDTSDGSEIWHVVAGDDSGHTMQVDASGNIHCGSYKFDSDGNTLVTYTYLGTNVAGAARTSFYDNNESRYYIGGAWVYWQGGVGWQYPKIRTQLDTNDDAKQWLTSTDTSNDVYGLLVIGDYVYAAHDYNINGAGYTITKLDTDFNTITGYDAEGMHGGHIWLDHDGNIACLVGRWDSGDPNAGVWTFDTDLNFIAKYLYDIRDFYGNEAVNVPYMTEGTPAIPGTPGHDANYAPVDFNAGAELCVYADGISIGTRTVFADANGTNLIDVNDEYNVVIAGLNYYSIYESFPLVASEIARNQKTITQRVALDLYQTKGVNLGTSMVYSSPIAFDDVNDLFMGYKIAEFPRGTFREPVIYLWEWEPYPWCLRGAYMREEIKIPE